MATLSFLENTSPDGRPSEEDRIELAESSQYRPSLRLFLGLLALLLLVQASLNVALNPVGLFRPSGLLLNSIRSSDTFLKLEALNAFLVRTEGHEITIALGSSRILLLSFSSEDDPDVFFFNAATSGGQPEDILAFTRHILNQPNVRIGRVYINADPFLLSSNTRYGGRIDGVYVLDKEIPPEGSRLQDLGTVITSLLSNEWLRAVREHRQSEIFPPVFFDDQTGVRNEMAVFAPQLATAGDRDSLLNQHVDRVLDSASFTKVSDQRVEDLKTAVALLTGHGAEVVLIFMPHEDRLWQGLMADPAYRNQIVHTKQLLASLAQDPKVTFCDFAAPEVLGLESVEYWWDGVHYTSEAAEIIEAGVETCVRADRAR